MRMSAAVRGAALFLFLAGVGYMMAVYPSLPDRIAVHFDMQNRPNGWADKESFYLLFIGLWGGLNVLILGLSGHLVGSMAVEKANVPWKGRWLSTPELRALLEDRLKALSAVIAGFINAVFLLCVRVIDQENAHSTAWRITPGMGAAILGGLALLLLVSVILVLKPPAGTGSRPVGGS